MRPQKTRPVVESKHVIRDWQIAEIKKGIAEADAGDFATQAEIDALFAKWAYNVARTRSPKT